MEPLGPQIRRQRRRLGLTLDELAGRTGISKPYLSLIENGRIPNPPRDEKLRRLEQSLGFGAGELLSQAHVQRTPRDVRLMLSNLLKKPVDDGAAAEGNTSAEESQLKEVLHQLVDRSSEEIAQLASHSVPVINKVDAGYPDDFTNLSYPPRVADDYVACPDVSDKDAFAARVAGDSMTPKYEEGNIVIFSPALTARDGDDCFVLFDDGQTTFRRVFFESDEQGHPTLRLQPRNEKYRPQMIAAEKAAGLYRAVFRYERVDGMKM